MVGLWNVAGRWLVWAVGLLLVLLGGAAIWQGIDIIQVERGWTSVIAGTTALCSGFLVLILGVLIDHVDALRRALLDRRASLPVLLEPDVPVMAEPMQDLEPSAPAEVPVAPPAKPAQTFSFRPFGKRQSGAVPPPPSAEPLPPLAEVPATPEPAAVEAAPAEPSEQVRRFAPPQFRRPSFMRAAREPDEVRQPEAPFMAQGMAQVMAQGAEIPPEPVAEATPVPPPPLPPVPSDDRQLPRAVPLPPLPPVAPVAEEPTPPVPEPEPLPEPVASQRSVAQQHEWLEKALSSDEAEPALDWLRKRRPEAEAQAEKRIPSFMLRREEAPVPEAPAVQSVEVAPAVAGEPPAAPDTLAVVGRYSANGADYTLYADGSIDAQMPEGTFRFGSMSELRAHLETQAPTHTA